jgi:uncharacterized protein (DUF58 family)
VKPSTSAAAATPGVYVSLDSLLRLKGRAQNFSFLPKQPVHSLLAGRHASRMRGRGLNFEEVRSYLPGDDIRNMDWKVTARMRKPHTRVYTEEKERPSLIVVDQRATMFFGSSENMKSWIATEAGALSAWRILGVGDRPGALVFNDTDAEETRPHRSTKNVLRILNSLVAYNQALNVDTASRPQRLNEVLERVVRLAQHDYLVNIVSDLSGADEDTERLLTRLAAHNDVLVLLVYDPLETTLPDAGRLTVSDGNLQLEIDSADARLRQQFADHFNERLESVTHLLKQRRIPVLPLSTIGGVAAQVQGLLGARLGSRIKR